MRFVRELMRFLFPRQRFWLNHGSRIINPYALTGASEEEKILILAGIARSPDDARLLMARYKTERAKEVLQHIARLQRQATFHDHLVRLARRLDGHDPRDVWGKPGKNDETSIRVEYRYRMKK